MHLFDGGRRTETRPKLHTEPAYQYLIGTARPPFQRVRDLLENWLGRYPWMDTPEWRGRFCSVLDWHHIAAFFELYCCALLDGQGLTLRPGQPSRSKQGTRPDFLVSGPGKGRLVFECTVAWAQGRSGGEEQRRNQVYERLRRLESPDFWLAIEILSAGPSDLSGKRLRHEVQAWLRTLNPDTLIQQKQYPESDYADGGWQVRLQAIPKPPQARGDAAVPPPHAIFTGPRLVAAPASLRAALEEKAGRYALQGQPNVIAVNVMDELPLLDPQAIANYLLGGRIRRSGEAPKGILLSARQPNGFWTMDKHTRVSGTLVADRMVPGDMITPQYERATRTPVLWHNPWAEHPLDPDVWQGPQIVADLDTDEIRFREGKESAEILGLEPGWPGWADDVRPG